MKPFRIVCLLVMTGVVGTAWAQDILELDRASMQRLGLVTMKLTATTQQQGALIPAQIISSPNTNAELSAVYDGVLERWLVTPGQQVKAGTLLGLVRSPSVLEAQQQWLQSVNQLSLSTQLLNRQKQLHADGVIAASRLQQAEWEFESAAIAQQSAAAMLINAGFDESALQSLRDEKEGLGIYRLLAPSNGLVSHLHELPGVAIETGDVLLSFNSEVMWLSAEIPARQAMSLSLSQQIQVQGQSVPLRVRQKDLAVDADLQTVGVLAEFTGSTALLPGQVVSLVLPAPEAAVVIPAEAVIHSEGKSLVYVLSSVGVEVRELQLQSFGSDYLAEAGISAGDEIVVKGAALLKGIQLGLGGE